MWKFYGFNVNGSKIWSPDRECYCLCYLWKKMVRIDACRVNFPAIALTLRCIMDKINLIFRLSSMQPLLAV